MRFEDYYKLAFEYLNTNPNQAYLCLQYAHMLCSDESVKAELNDAMNMLHSECGVQVKNTAIVIVSYNCKYMLQKNIESIRNTLPDDSYIIYVVDNASSDGVTEWLEMQEDIILIKNTENVGFAPACNQAVITADQIGDTDSDIFLLNNDTRLAEASLFWLKMGLYESDNVGAAGSISNYAGNEQQVDIMFDMPSDYLEYGRNNNVFMTQPYEERVRLSGFAMLIKRSAWNSAGGMDEDFAPGYFEDDDLSVKISKEGYRQLLCKNSFIYHAGSQSFSKRDNINTLLDNHRKLFLEKHGFDIISYAKPRYELISQIKYGIDDVFNVLVVGSGLSADAKYIRSIYPRADIVSLEKNTSLRTVAEKVETVLPSANILKRLISKPVFNVLIFDAREIHNYTQEEIDIIASVCMPGCQVIKNPVNSSNIDLKKVKLIIWDMDDTFWMGTISEGDVSISPIMARLVIDLTERGIINSISSKNDEKIVMDKLAQNGIDKLFVFNNINWQAKGPQIAEKLSLMGLRAENVLFIDDNPRNLQEAVYTCPGLMISEPYIIPKISEYVNASVRTDREHSRLRQYQLLEKKNSAKAEYAQGEEFLYDSEIKAYVYRGEKACRLEIDRLTDLVGRANQLNYTKCRRSRDELIEDLKTAGDNCGYIRVADKFGDYGVVGFFCFDENAVLKHFLFSCRTLGMGVERAIYKYLNSPILTVIQPVAAEITETDMAPWVEISEIVESETTDISVQASEEIKDGKHILLKGPCDMDSIAVYLPYQNMETEFNYINSLGFITTGQNHTMHMVEASECSDEEIVEILREVPFLIRGDFETDIFDKEYDVICYSLLPDCHAGLYRNIETGKYISFGSKNYDLTDISNMDGYISGSIQNHGFRFTEGIIREFSKNWEFMGCTPLDKLIENLEFICSHVKGNPRIIFMLGSEKEYEGENTEFANHAMWHREVNERVKVFASQRANIECINTTDYIDRQSCFLDSTNHYSREVYHRLAERLMELADK